MSSHATMKDRTVLDSEFEELASPTAQDADATAGCFQANVFTSSASGVENISFESLLPQRRPLWKAQREERSWPGKRKLRYLGCQGPACFCFWVLESLWRGTLSPGSLRSRGLSDGGRHAIAEGLGALQILRCECPVQ